VAVQRLEAAEARKAAEKERRLMQERERVTRERTVRAKVAAATFARGYLNGIVSNVFDNLSKAGYFYNPRERDITEQFMPWLVEQVRRT